MPAREKERKGEANGDEEERKSYRRRTSSSSSRSPSPPPCLFPSFWILYRERYAKVCMHEGRSNGQESREFVRSTAARIRTRYSFLLDSGIRGSRRRHVLYRIIAVVVVLVFFFFFFFVYYIVIVIVVVVVVMSVAGEAALSRDARALPVDR